MTEEEWNQSDDPRRLLSSIAALPPARKLRLFVCAECRRQQSNVVRSLFLDALDVAERFADGLVDDQTRAAASRRTALGSSGRVGLTQARAQGLIHWAVQSDEEMYQAASTALAQKTAGLKWQANVLRELFGNPFRPVAFDPRWRTSDVTELARAIYDDRAFDRMPILADALMDAGCADEQILSHCRGNGPHVRGCWVVDLVLGKE